MRMRSSHGFVIVSTIVAIVHGCGPAEGGDRDDPPGMLEYEDPDTRYYRLDRRVEIVVADPQLARPGCGFLTDRAHDDITGTLEVLDRSSRYDPPDECTYGPPDGLLYLDGLEHSPFECSWWCCNIDIRPIAVVYFAVGSNLYDQEPNIDGEPYVALEPDMPCPD